MTIFSRDEYEQRVQATKQRMEQQGLDTLIVTDPANINYLTGYDGWSFYVPQAIIVSLILSEPLWVGREQDSNGARLTCWMSESTIKPYADYYVQSVVRHPMDYVAQVVRGYGLDHGRIGVEMDAYYFSALSFHKLVQGLPDARFADATLLVNWIRLIKSDQEVALIKQAAAIVTRAMGTAMDVIRTGVRECDAAAEILRAQIQGTEEIGGDYPAIVPLIPSGVRTGTAHLSWIDRRYEPGDTVNIEIAGCVRRYHCPLARSAVIGVPSPQLIELSQVVAEGVTAALDVVKPGSLAEDVEAAWQKVIQHYGYHKASRLGYAVGLNYPPDWGEHTVSLRAGDMSELQPNMVFHLIAGMWLDGYGLEISETFRVVPEGVEVLTGTERKLFVLEEPQALCS
ncbi:MAG: M24 family metallopeptidase [Firmicutes bacterium]|nr:M24 family metallopeptidase [Bacillota bacterium]MCL5013863.1 M24 family metallopeptidase [Bacillota bacterium]